jgi:hypothetical protein
MQAYATAEMAPAAELRVLDRRPPIPSSTDPAADARNVVREQLLGQLADLVGGEGRCPARNTSERGRQRMDGHAAGRRIPRHPP